MEFPNIAAIWEQITTAFVKFVPISALVAIFIKIAVQVRRKQATIFGSILSLFIGCGTAYLTKGLIYDWFDSDGTRTVLVAFVAIMSDKIMDYLLYKTNIDKFFDLIGAEITEKVKKWFNK